MGRIALTEVTKIALFVQETHSQASMDSLEKSSYSFLLLKMLLVLAAICIIAYSVLKWGVPRAAGFSRRSDPLFKVVTRFPLEPKKSIYLIEVAQRFILLGVSENQMNYLTDLDETSVREAIAEVVKATEARKIKEERSFYEILKQKIKRERAS